MRKRNFPLSFFLWAVVLLLLTAAKRSDLKLVLTSTENAGEPEIFDCAGRVYAHLTFAESFHGKHEIEALWLKPDGALQERTQLPVNFARKGTKTVRLWLGFDDKPKGILDEFSFGGDYGGTHEFSGEWRVKILWDGRFLTESAFNVVCD